MVLEVEEHEDHHDSEYRATYHAAQISTVSLQVTALIEACALGMPAAAADELERVEQIGGGAAVFVELRAADDWSGWTPLHWGAYSDSGEVVNLLLRADADPAALSSKALSTPLHVAARYGSTEAAVALLGAGAVADEANRIGNTPLHECCTSAFALLREPTDSLRVAKELLLARAPLDVYNKPAPPARAAQPSVLRGCTPLHIAAEAGAVEMIRLLVAWGADPFVVCLLGEEEASPVEPAKSGALGSGDDSPRSAGARSAPLRRPSAAEGKSSWRRKSSAVERWVRRRSSTSLGLCGRSRSLVTAGLGRPPPRGTPLQLAVRAANLLAVAELLLCMWRRTGKPHAYVDVELLDRQEAVDTILRVWVRDEPMRRSPATIVKAITIIVLSLSTPPNSTHLTPRNPVLDALRMSVHCRHEASRLERTGRWQLGATVRSLATIFQLVALALLDGSQAATDEASAPYSRWKGGAIQPGLAHALWLHGGAAFGAAHKCDVFVADSLVYSHVKQVFYPRLLPRGGPLLHTAFVARNLLWLPLLVVLPAATAAARVERQNNAAGGEPEGAWVLWLFPCGGAALRLVSAVCLALLLTLHAPPTDGQLGAADALLCLWTAAVGQSVCEEIYAHGWSDWSAEVFNALDAALLLPLGGMAACCARDVAGGAPSADAAQLRTSLQAVGSLLAWLRLLRACYYSPSAGPQLLTILHLLGDLAALMPLMTFFLLAYACAFAVLCYADERDESFFVFFVQMLRQLVGVTLNGEPQTLQTSLPGAGYATNTGAELSIFVLMTSFGLLVVVLMLSMIVAKFARSVEYVAGSIDRVYKLKFAQVTYASYASLHTSDLAPQPLNVLRRLALALTGCAAAAAPLARAPPRRVVPQPGARAAAELAREVSRFLEAAITEVKMLPEHADEYYHAHEYLLNQGVAEVDFVSRVTDLRRALDMQSAAFRAAHERHDELLQKQAHYAKATAEQLARADERLAHLEASADGQPAARRAAQQRRGHSRTFLSRCGGSLRDVSSVLKLPSGSSRGASNVLADHGPSATLSEHQE
ncbi:hypothetical protein AB1Y20_008804 [Prymnesium parvum]|uniref:Ion transport domain-containing protein n=1 Tax=Prymnesium parvum TaxID=97485 RepID=A0AB34IUK8_PRYPA